MTELKEIYDKIYRYCFYRLRNSAAAEDITQEAFLRYFAPFLLVNGISLAAFTRFRGQEGSYISAAAAIFVSMTGLMLWGGRIRLPENTLNRACMLICVFGAVSAAVNMKKIMCGIDHDLRKGQI